MSALNHFRHTLVAVLALNFWSGPTYAESDCLLAWKSKEFFKTASAADVEECLAAGAEVDAQDSKRRTPLHMAVEHGAIDAVQALIDAGADPNAPARGKWTSLHYAAKHGTTETVNALLAAGADTNARTDTDATPLHVAAQQGSADTVGALVAAGAAIDVRNRQRLTPLYYAKERGDADALAVLLDAGADCFENWNSEDFFKAATTIDVERCLEFGSDPNARGQNDKAPLHWAAASGSAEVIAALVAAGAEVDAQDSKQQTPIHIAVKEGTANTVGALVAAGADFDTGERSPLYYAKQRGDADVLAVLLDTGAECFESWNSREFFSAATAADVEQCVALGFDPNARDSADWTPLHVAVEHGAIEAARALIDAGADPNARTENGSTPLHDAALRSSAETVRVLLEASADANARANNDATPLHYAVKRDTAEIVRALLNVGADVNASANNGAAPLHDAALSGSAETVRVLLEAGADVNVRVNNGATPLHNAATRDTAEMVRALLDAGADLNPLAGRGWTPLHAAVREGGTAGTVGALVAAGAALGVRDDYRRTPLDYAKERGDSDVLTVLLEAGAECFESWHSNEFFKSATATDVERCLKIGADPNARDRYDQTPLHHAALSGSAEVVAALLAAGADIGAKRGRSGGRPHDLAKSRGDADVLAVLLDAGAGCFDNWNDPVFLSSATAADIAQCLALGLDPNASNINGTTPLHWAAEEGNAGAVSALISGGADPNAGDGRWGSPLHYAALRDTPEAVDALVAVGANPNSRNIDGATPLHVAAEKSSRVVAALIAAGATPFVRNNYDETPLYHAKRWGNAETVAVLREAGAECFDSWNTHEFFNVATAADVEQCLDLGFDPNARAFNRTPLHHAAKRGMIDAVGSLIEAGAHPNARDGYDLTPLHYAAESGDADTIAALLAAGADQNDRARGGWTPLHEAAHSGGAEAVAALLAAGADPNDRTEGGWTPLHVAAEFSTAQSVLALLDAGADPNAEGKNEMTPFDLARSNAKLAGTDAYRRLEHLSCPHWNTPRGEPFKDATVADIEQCLDGGADPNHRNPISESTPLHRAAQFGNVEAVRALLAAGADIEARATFGDNSWTSLHLAAGSGSAETVLELLAAGADIEARNKSGVTPLRWAITMRDAEIFEALLLGGADPNARDKSGETPLHWAAMVDFGGDGEIEMLAALLDAGADPNARGNSQRTPLHNAAIGGSAERIAALLDAGADPKVPDGAGKIPFAYVRGDASLAGTDAYRRLAVPGHELPECEESNTGTIFPAATAVLVEQCLGSGADITAADETASQAWTGGEPNQIEILREIISGKNFWRVEKPEGMRSGTRSHSKWKEAQQKRRRQAADIPFSREQALEVLSSIGLRDRIKKGQGIMEDHPFNAMGQIVKLIFELPEQELAAFEVHRIANWRCMPKSNMRDDATLRSYLFGEQLIPKNFNDCWFPIEVRGSFGAISEGEALVNAIRALTKSVSDGGEMGSLDVEGFLMNPYFDPNRPPYFDFELFGDQGFTRVTGESVAMFSDVLEFDGYLFCFDDKTYIDTCYVSATRVENLGEYFEGAFEE